MRQSGSVRADWLRAVLDRCQGIASADGADDGRDGERALLQGIPAPETPLEELIVRGLVGELTPRQAGHPKVPRALLAIERSYANPNLRLSDVAAAVGLTAGHLCRLLRNDTSRGFVEILKSVRLQKAAALLKLQVMSVKEVAAAVGYKYPGDLTRDFRRRNGVTPTVWRRLQADSARMESAVHSSDAPTCLTRRQEPGETASPGRSLGSR